MAQAREVVPVMDEKVAPKARAPKAGSRSTGARKGLGGVYGASFTGEGTRGLTFERRWTRPGVHPYDEITWEYRTAGISSETGKTVFEQKDVEVPTSWSQLATNVVVSKYFRGHVGTPEREHSVRQLIDRVVTTIAAWAETQRYFATDEDLAAFQAELTHLLVHQKMSFNSPVWFNVGIEAKPQCSACFINSVQDNMSSIMDLAKTEAMLFKYGSGAGVNLSPIRSSKARMSGGGIASGPVSFMRGYDAFAGVIKSGGKTRRAAKMVILDVDHPDVIDFIESKASEERKAWALIEQGYDASFTGEAYGSRVLPERQPQRPRHRRIHDGRGARRRVADPRGHRRAAGRHLQGARHLPQDGRGGAPVRRPGHPVRHHHQRLEPGLGHGPPVRHQPVQRVQLHQRFQLQPRVGQPDEVRRSGGRVRRRRVPPRLPGDDHRPGDPGRQRQLPDGADRGEQPPVPAAGPGLRQSRRAADEPGLRLRLGQRAGLRRRRDRDHARRGVPPERRHRPRPWRPVRGLRDEPRAVPPRRRDASRRRPPDLRGQRAGRDAGGGPHHDRRGARDRPGARLPERAGESACSNRHDCVHDGLRHHRHRARHRPREVQEAGRRGLPQDRQPDGPGGPAQARLLARPRSRRSSPTSTSARPSRARPASGPSTYPSSTAPSSPSTASGPSTTWATSG